MSLFFESIKIENGKPANIFFHNERINKARRDLLKINNQLNLENIISIPQDLKNIVYKCRVFYDYEIHKIEFVEYEKKNIKKLIAVNANEISYGYKFTDRSAIDKLKLENTNSAEEDILIIKNDIVTDTSFSNVLFYDGKDWFTPKECLLPGTQRAKMLSEKRVIERSIKRDDLFQYKKIKLINAMVEFDYAATLSTDSIIVKDKNDRR